MPHVIEPAAGGGSHGAGFIYAYHEETITNEKGKEARVVMKFHPRIAPYKVGVFPLLKNKPELVAKAREVCKLLRRTWRCFMMKAAPLADAIAVKTRPARPTV